MKTIKNYLLFLATVTLYGCSGKIITSNLTPEDITAKGNKFDGVIYYTIDIFIEEYRTTVRIDDKGNKIGSETGIGVAKCDPITQQKIVARADYDHPKLISYDHGFLENYTFNVELNPDGSLKSANSESSPDRGQTFENLSSAAVNGAKTAGVVAAAAGTPACNDGSVLVEIRRANVKPT